MRVSVGTIVRRPLGEVFDYVADMGNDVHWAPLVEAVEQLEGKGPGEGAVWRIQQRAKDRVVPMDWRMEAYSRPALLAWRSETRKVRVHVSMAFAPHAKGTAIKQTSTQTWDMPWYVKILAPFLVRRVLKRQFKALRNELERGEK